MYTQQWIDYSFVAKLLYIPIIGTYLSTVDLAIVCSVLHKIAIFSAENLCFFEESIFTHFKGQKKKPLTKLRLL